MKTINVNGLVAILSAINTPTFINMVTETKVRMNKTGNPYFDKVFKVKQGNYLIGTNYENRVNNNLVKEGKDNDFQASENKVGQHVSKCVLFNEKTGKHYLQHERFDNSIIDTRYVFEGKDIDLKAFEKFMPSSNNYENQGLDKTVKVLSVTVDNIKLITINKETYLITK
jgi:hypothetical protein